MPAKVDRSALFGKRFGRWTALGEIKATRWKAGRQAWSPDWRIVCRCDCGTFGSIPPEKLLSGRARSCGCLRAELTSQRKTTHGHTKGGVYTPEYISWLRMRQRCLDKNCPEYPRYGGAGVTVHQDWIDSFPAFFQHIGPKPFAEATIDRMNKRLGYQPGNVRWASKKQQARNRTSNRLVDVGGKLVCVAEASEATGLNSTTIRQRIAYGWPPSDLLKPLGYRRARVSTSKRTS